MVIICINYIKIYTKTIFYACENNCEKDISLLRGVNDVGILIKNKSK